MPQKRNPDVFELARARCGRVLGNLVSLLATLKGLPAGYSKDLQEDKVILFDAVDGMLLLLPAVRGAVETLEANPERMRSALDSSMLATDLADGLVKKGVPFREAHHLVGQLVRAAEAGSIPIDRIPRDTARRIHSALPDLISSLGSWEDSVERRGTAGGSSRKAVLSQLEALEAMFRD
jgi:argininosuccinate lyase